MLASHGIGQIKRLKFKSQTGRFAMGPIMAMIRNWKSISLEIDISVHNLNWNLTDSADTLAFKYITHIRFGENTPVRSSVMCKINTIFPELQVASFKYVSFGDDVNNLTHRDYLHKSGMYEMSQKSPRLRSLEISACAENVASAEEIRKEISALFFSLIHNSPQLQSFSYNYVDSSRCPLYYACRHYNRLFCAAQELGPGKWKGVANRSLRSLKLSGWTLEWDMLTTDGYKFELPNVVEVEVTNCTSVRKEASLVNTFAGA